MLSGVAYLHRQGLVHWRLKPSKVRGGVAVPHTESARGGVTARGGWPSMGHSLGTALSPLAPWRLARALEWPPVPCVPGARGGLGPSLLLGP